MTLDLLSKFIFLINECLGYSFLPYSSINALDFILITMFRFFGDIWYPFWVYFCLKFVPVT